MINLSNTQGSTEVLCIYVYSQNHLLQRKFQIFQDISWFENLRKFVFNIIF